MEETTGLKNPEVSQVCRTLCLDVRVRKRVMSRLIATFLTWMTG